MYYQEGDHGGERGLVALLLLVVVEVSGRLEEKDASPPDTQLLCHFPSRDEHVPVHCPELVVPGGDQLVLGLHHELLEQLLLVLPGHRLVAQLPIGERWRSLAELVPNIPVGFSNIESTSYFHFRVEFPTLLSFSISSRLTTDAGEKCWPILL